MNKNIFEIRALKCKYESNPFPVLEIEELNIEKGSKTFFIGPSGVGKSTILETLGLMNDTIYEPKRNNSVFDFIYGKRQSLIDIWSKKESAIAEFRNQHLSFIFQNTNLFKTLSAYDNIAISAILQGKTKDEAMRKTKKIVARILPDILENKPITELSGGQRQRIAFARAIVTDYAVLFADEPTGNLDRSTADLVMDVLNEYIIANSAALFVVTHDIDIAKKAQKLYLLEDKKLIIR
jgi:ABC-type lipoprotein export system ATPase subunit